LICSQTIKSGDNELALPPQLAAIVVTRSISILIILLLVAQTSWSQDAESSSRLPDHYIPLIPMEELQPTPPILELGPGLLEIGPLERGFESPTGAIWRPSFWVYGNLRSGVNVVNPSDNGHRLIEWANQLELFGNLQLTGTERFLVGIEPLQERGQFTRYTSEPEAENGWYDHTNLDITTLFFEGELSELFPGLDKESNRQLDYGFSIGRWEVDLQDGILVNDKMDAIGVTKFLAVPGTSMMRLSFIYGWNELNRNNNQLVDESRFFAISTETDTYSSTIDADLVVIDAPVLEGGDGIYAGLGLSQRIKKWGRTFNTTVRWCASHAEEEDNPEVSDGMLFFAEASTTPYGTDDIAYGTLFLAIDEFASAARGPAKGGPLGKAGLLFAAVELGSFSAALGNGADRAFGGALGYQWIMAEGRNNFIVELGARAPTEVGDVATGAIGVRYQKKLSDRIMLQCDGYSKLTENGDNGNGIRTEFLVRF